MKLPGKKRLVSRVGFTLIELLTVVVIIGMVFAFTVPSYKEAVGNTRLRGEGYRFSSELARAQQLAVTMNHSVEVRFYRFEDPADDEPGARWRGVRFFNPDQTSDEYPGGVPIGDFVRVEDGVLFSSKDDHFSTIFSLPSSVDTVDFGGESPVQATVVGFVFFPSGATNLPDLASSPGGDGWYVSLVKSTDETRDATVDEVKNFITVQVDPANGSVKTYQP